MSNFKDDEYKELIYYVTELRGKFNGKLDDHLFIIEQQRDRIEFQQQQIDDQRITIDELAWQIRDLRDSVRQCCEQISKQNNNFCECSSKCINSSASTTNRGKLGRQSHVEEEVSPLYESINFDRENISIEAHPIALKCTNIITPSHKNAMNTSKTDSKDYEDLFECNEYPVRSNRFRLLFDEIKPPPPPATSPPIDTDTDQLQISAVTFERLNKLYEIRNFARDSVDGDDPSDIDGVVYRTREFKDFSQRSQRGSSKALCSLFSDVESDYLPKVEEVEEESDSTTDNVQLRSKNSELMNEIQCKITQTTTYTSNVTPEVYI